MSSHEGVDGLRVANLADGVLSVTLDRPNSLVRLGQTALLSGTDFPEGIRAFQHHRNPVFTDS